MRKHTVTKWGAHPADAYVSNGIIGFRFEKNPFVRPIGMMAGFTTLREKKQVEAMAILPTPEMTFEVDGKAVEPQVISQSYDFSNGELTTELQLGKIALSHTVYCSRTSPTLLMTHLNFSNNGGEPVEVGIDVSFDVREEHRYTLSEVKLWAPDSVKDKHSLEFPNDRNFDGKCLQYSYDKTTAVGIAYKIFGGECVKKTYVEHPSTVMSERLEFTLNGDLKKLDFVTSYIPSSMHSEPHNQAHRMLQIAKWQGFDQIREANRKAWAKLWESRITVDGASEKWQDAIDASFFYLMTSVSEFSPFSVAPYGLSHPDEYEGHYFWDTESFMFMTPMLCAPEVARAMLEYRSKRLEAYRNNARINGYRGIQFPWQSGNTGSEVTVLTCLMAPTEHHVNMDVALAFDGFARVSGDIEFIKEHAWPVMRGVAEWIESRVTKTEQGYEIRHITGIYEGPEDYDVNNDSYTNLVAIKVLRSAAEYSEKLGYGEKKKWKNIADKMVLPISKDGVMMQYECVTEREKAFPTALMAYFPYGYTDENMSKTIDYYMNHGMIDFCRFPMQSGTMGVFPAWNGDRDASLKMFEKANFTFFCQPFYSHVEWSIGDPQLTVDMSKPMKTNFITARGSLLMGLIMGLTKLCPWRGNLDGDIDEWLGDNIVLPTGWNKITVGKVFLRGKAYRLIAEHGAKKAILEEIE